MKPILGTQLNPYHPLNQGLVACYEFNERAGLIASDISKYRNHSVLINNPEWAPNVFGGGLDFVTASNQYIDAGTAIGNALGNGISSLSVSLWFKMDTGGGLFYIGDLLSTFGEMHLLLQTNLVYLRLSNVAFNESAAFTDTASWNHIIAQYTGSKGQLYLNNSLVIDENWSTDLDLSGLKTVIGTYYNGTLSTFDGKIGQVRIYNRVLSPSEITQLSLRPDDLYLKDDITSWAFIPGYGLKYTNGSTGVLTHMRETNGVSGAEIVLKRTNGSTGDVINTAGV